MSAARRLRVTVAAGGALALSSLARADAPTDQYGIFDLGTVVIQDAQTGLAWQRYASATAVNLDAATSRCAGLSFPGFVGGWRVPSYKELLTLVDEVPHVEYENAGLVTKSIDGNAFPGALVDELYWSSSTYLGFSQSAYVVNFETGEGENQSMNSTGYVRCVR
ncbi:MAG: DUF1566 domain-containing protein [Polyangiaceae bacterium]